MATVAQKSKYLQPLVVYPKPPAVSPKIPVENATREDAAMKILHPLLAQAAVALAMTATKILAKEEEDVAKLAIKEKFANAFGRARNNDCCSDECCEDTSSSTSDCNVGCQHQHATTSLPVP